MSDTAIISCIALIISFISPIYTYIKTKRINDITLKSQHLKEIYKDFLMDKIPVNMNCITYKDNCLNNTIELQKTLIELLKSLSFYKYIDKDFYTDIKIAIQTLEDYIVLNEGEIFETSEIPKEEIEKDLSDIYNIINQKYIDG